MRAADGMGNRGGVDVALRSLAVALELEGDPFLGNSSGDLGAVSPAYIEAPHLASGSVSAYQRNGGIVGILEGKRILVTGVLTDDSLAFGSGTTGHRARRRDSPDRIRSGLVAHQPRSTASSQARLRSTSSTPRVEEQADQVAQQLENRWGALDGVSPRIGYAPDICLGSGVLPAAWNDVATAIGVSAYSLKVLAGLHPPCQPTPQEAGR